MQYHPFRLDERKGEREEGQKGEMGKRQISQAAKGAQNMPLDAMREEHIAHCYVHAKDDRQGKQVQTQKERKLDEILK